MSQPFPHHYEATLVREEGSRAALSSGARPILVGGPPPEFDGEPGWWSPEHLLLSAANLCFMTTYMAFAKKADVEIAQYRSRAEGTLEKTREGILFTRISVHLDIQAPPQHLEQARKLVETAKKYCIVSNALKRPAEVDATVAPSGASAEGPG